MRTNTSLRHNYAGRIIHFKMPPITIFHNLVCMHNLWQQSKMCISQNKCGRADSLFSNNGCYILSLLLLQVNSCRRRRWISCKVHKHSSVNQLSTTSSLFNYALTLKIEFIPVEKMRHSVCDSSCACWLNDVIEFKELLRRINQNFSFFLV